MNANIVRAAEIEPAQYLTFMLAQEQFAIGILGIKEIIEYQGVTEVPMMPPCVRGVINLRGAVVPIIDLRIKFNFAKAEYNEFTVVIILNVGARVVGVVVDGVSDVITLGTEQIKPAPSLGNNADTSHIIGFGTLDDRMRILMDVERLMAGADLGSIKLQ